MAHVPDQAITRRIEDPMQGHGQLDDAEAGAEVAAGDGDSIDRLLAKLAGKLRQLALVQLAQRVGGFHAIEQRRF